MKNQHVLIIGTVWVEPNSSAAGGRMLQLITVFLKQNWCVTFASAAQKNENAFNLKQWNVDENQIELNDASFDDFIKKLQPTMVVFDRFMTEEQFGWRVAENCPNSLRILDTEDLHFLRKTRQEQLKKGEQFSTEALLKSTVAKREIAAILRCDISLIISTYEMELLKNVFKIDAKILLHLPFLMNAIDEKHQKKWNPFSERNHFAFIGNFFHAPNVDAVLFLKNKLWKNIKKQLPSAEMHIYGAYITPQIQQLHNPKEGFLIKGFAKNSSETIESAKIMLAPLRFGAGIKGKLTQAMECGTPSITTKIGAEGMHQNLPWNGFVNDDINEFISNSVALFTDEKLWKNSQKNGIKIINKIYDVEKNSTLFMEAILAIQNDLKDHRLHNFLGNLLQHQSVQATKFMSKWIEEKNRVKK